MNEAVLSVSDFVALVNQTFEYAYNYVVIVGELANFKVSKNKWVYFDLKDDLASVRFFGSVYTMPGPLEDGMILEVHGNPRLHPQFGFSVTVQAMRPVGEGSIKKAANLLEAKLRAEGLFNEDRKRQLPYPPQRIGLITSAEAAAYVDFIKVLNHRWRGLEIQHIDVQVQGQSAVTQIVAAIEQFNQMAVQPDNLVIIRGGGSPDDLQAFNTEQVARAVAGSRIPTLVAIGHEIDVSLAELVADKRASTPSNAAELLVPDRREVMKSLVVQAESMRVRMKNVIKGDRDRLATTSLALGRHMQAIFELATVHNERRRQLVEALSPNTALKRGYAILRTSKGLVVRTGKALAVNDIVDVQLFDASVSSQIKQIKVKE